MTNQPNQHQHRQLPPEIYRRRRIAALVLLAVLILLIALVVKCSVGGGDEDATDRAADGAGEKVTVSRTDGSEVTSSPGSDRDAGRDGRPGAATTEDAPYKRPAEEPERVDKDTCEAADLRLTVQSDQPNYSGDDKPTFSLTLTNPTNGECRIDLAKEKVAFEVYRLGDYRRVWSDQDCHDGDDPGEETIAPGAAVTWDLTWSGLRSAPNACGEADRTRIEPGPYMVYGLLGERNSDAYTFNVR